MKLLAILTAISFLGACSMSEKGFVEQPDQYGLYVAVTNVAMDIPLQIKSEETGEVISIQTKPFGMNGRGYLEESLKPGRYYIYSYHPYANVTVPLLTATGYFDIQVNCFNYGGYLNFGMDGNRPEYRNTIDLMDIHQLPQSMSNLAKGKDICMAPLGKTNQRFRYGDIKDLLSL